MLNCIIGWLLVDYLVLHESPSGLEARQTPLVASRQAHTHMYTKVSALFALYFEILLHYIYCTIKLKSYLLVVALTLTCVFIKI